MSTEQNPNEVAGGGSALNVELDVLKRMFDCYQELKKHGWREAQYCPKDGTTVYLIEAGSTGVHKGHYLGEWPNGTFLIEDAKDLWPSRPILFKPITKASKFKIDPCPGCNPTGVFRYGDERCNLCEGFGFTASNAKLTRAQLDTEQSRDASWRRVE